MLIFFLMNKHLPNKIIIFDSRVEVGVKWINVMTVQMYDYPNKGDLLGVIKYDKYRK